MHFSSKLRSVNVASYWVGILVVVAAIACMSAVDFISFACISFFLWCSWNFSVSLFLCVCVRVCAFLHSTGSSMSYPVFFVASLLYKCWTWFSLRDCFPCFHLRQMIYSSKVSSFCISEWWLCCMNLSTISLASLMHIVGFFLLLSIIYTLNTYMYRGKDGGTCTHTLSICILICFVCEVRYFTPGWYLFVYYSREKRVRGFSFTLLFSIYLGFMKNCKKNGRV